MRRETRSRAIPLLAASFALVWAAAASAQECSDCHEVDPAAFAGTVHGFLDCVDCHAAAGQLPHGENPGDVDCATCHDDVAEQYVASIHGQAVARGAAEAPACASCHGSVHALVPVSDPASPVSPLNLPATCGSCHSDPAVVAKFGIPVATPVEAYRSSVHAHTLRDRGVGASCNSCHGSHAIQGAEHPDSPVNHLNVPATCGKCHAEIAAAYEESVHGKAAAHGVREAPVCTDCHGEHRILAPSETDSPVYATNIPKMTCGRCHSDVRMAMKFGLPADKVPAYEDSYHGLAMRAGAPTVAHCGSCHGVHEVLPESDPRSLVNPANLARTCGRCHPGAGERFAIGPVHVSARERQHAAVYWVRWTYLWLIWGTIGGMLLHNALDMRRKFRDPALLVALPPPSTERMGLGFRVAHGLLGASFIVLVYTGFALTYPESWWARPVLRWEASFALRGWIHRTASLVLLGSLGFHFVHLIVNKSARACIAGMRPTIHDWHELRARVAYWFDRSQPAPRAPRLGYPEKLEYLALMWGIGVMAVTGFLLWFDEIALRYLPKWSTDVATVIHFYEAVLASLAILVWHFYFVIFDPMVYPMDTAWLTGKSAPGRALERGDPTESSWQEAGEPGAAARRARD